MRGLGAAGRRRGRRGSPASEVEDELGVLVVGAPVSNGLHQTKQRATAVLGDTLGRRGGHGGRVNDGERRRPRRAWGRKERRGSGGEKREAQRPRGERGRVGERPEEAGGAGALILPVAGEVVRRGPAPVPTPVGGTGKGRASGRGGPGWSWAFRPGGGGWCWPAGPGVGPVGPGPVGGLLFLFFCFLFCFAFSFIYFLSPFNPF